MGSTQWGYGHNTYCESFTEFIEGCGWQGVSAIAAWNNNAARRVTAPQPGDAIYFEPADDNGGYGHTGIVTGPDRFTSVTYNGVQSYLISWWNQYSAKVLGYVRY